MLRILIAALVLIPSISHACMSDPEFVKATFSKIDTDANGNISFDEFLADAKIQNEKFKNDQPSAASKFIGSKFFGRNYAQWQPLNEEAVKNNFNSIDKNQDGRLNFEEYSSGTMTKRC